MTTTPQPSRETKPLPRRGLILIIASPSGAGKSTLSRLLLQADDRLTLSVSVTTRLRRPSEVDALHYHFIDQHQFEMLRERGELLEWAQVHGNFYGTPRRPVETALEAGRDYLFDIDVQGTLQVYKAMRSDVASVFILPPSIPELVERLRRRAEDDESTIQKRLASAAAEISHWRDFDYVLVNDDLNRTFADLRTILAAERMKRSRNEPPLELVADPLAAERLKRSRNEPGLEHLVQELLAELGRKKLS
ncbi:MAG: guanylate kinase [Hyphomicrobiales bacterium]|nr:guanylate kinase [Hyphomicrobiales bacterium]MBV9433224.1 guanylate kinase [Hyphomicrobiales bacterium]